MRFRIVDDAGTYTVEGWDNLRKEVEKFEAKSYNKWVIVKA